MDDTTKCATCGNNPCICPVTPETTTPETSTLETPTTEVSVEETPAQ